MRIGRSGHEQLSSTLYAFLEATFGVAVFVVCVETVDFWSCCTVPETGRENEREQKCVKDFNNL